MRIRPLTSIILRKSLRLFRKKEPRPTPPRSIRYEWRAIQFWRNGRQASFTTREWNAAVKEFFKRSVEKAKASPNSIPPSLTALSQKVNSLFFYNGKNFFTGDDTPANIRIVLFEGGKILYYVKTKSGADLLYSLKYDEKTKTIVPVLVNPPAVLARFLAQNRKESIIRADAAGFGSPFGRRMPGLWMSSLIMD